MRHGFRTTFSTLSHHEEIKDAKAWDGDVVELQLAHLDNSTVEGLYKKHGPLALIGSRTKLMQHWADRIDHWLDPKKVMPIKREMFHTGEVQGAISCALTKNQTKSITSFSRHPCPEKSGTAGAHKPANARSARLRRLNQPEIMNRRGGLRDECRHSGWQRGSLKSC